MRIIHCIPRVSAVRRADTQPHTSTNASAHTHIHCESSPKTCPAGVSEPSSLVTDLRTSCGARGQWIPASRLSEPPQRLRENDTDHAHGTGNRLLQTERPTVVRDSAGALGIKSSHELLLRLCAEADSQVASRLYHLLLATTHGVRSCSATCVHVAHVQPPESSRHDFDQNAGTGLWSSPLQ